MAAAALLHSALLLGVAVYSSYGGCTFPESWTGSWFQSGFPGLIAINSTHIYSKGECSETESFDKFLLYDRGDDCYRCMVIHEKHKYVLQYKETYCSQKDSLASICESISGDAPLYSMFRKEPRPAPQPCPFHPAPFTFTYNRGSGECVNPPSRAEACTDDSRLLLRYMACPDVPGTESNVEELVCLATWKEGSTRYLVGQLLQVRRNTIASDEDTYRCFIYKGQHTDKTTTYNIAQSGDATCNGLSSPMDGSRTMRLTNSDDEHNRCHFPAWIVQHHKWFSLDRARQYHFTTKNATLKVMNADGSVEEKRVVCHSILEQRERQHIKLVAHVTKDCESGHVCLWFWRRGAGVLELASGAALWDAPQDACAQPPDEHVTLITTALPATRCPLAGRYAVLGSLADRRRRRQQTAIGEAGEGSEAAECVAGDYHSAEMGCGPGQDTIEFKSHCASTVYTCYGSWTDGARGFVLAAPAGAGGAGGGGHPRVFCFMYSQHAHNDSVTALSLSEAPAGGVLALSGASHSCSRRLRPGHDGDKAYNLTLNGTCEQSSKYNSAAARALPAAALLALLAALLPLPAPAAAPRAR